MVSLCVGGCDAVGVMVAVGVVSLVNAADVVVSCSSASRCLNGSLSLPLLSLIILIISSSPCSTVPWLDYRNCV